MTGEELLALAIKKKAELLTLTTVLFLLTDEEDERTVPSFGGEIPRLNARDARWKPIAELHERVVKQLTLEPRPEERAAARAAAAPWVRWRTALRRDPDAPMPG